MFGGRVRTLDILLLLIVLLLAVVILAMLALPAAPPTPTRQPTPTLRATATATPPPTLTATLRLRTTRAPTATASPSPTPLSPPTRAPTPTPATQVSVGEAPTPLPLVSRDAPLPHSGLFIRRHNELGAPFEDAGAPPAAGPFPLGETEIDPATLSPAAISPPVQRAVAAPPAGEALAVHVGIVPITWDAPRDSRATHVLEIALRAAPASARAGAALPANTIFVADTSGSMEGAKITALRSAIRTLVADMRPEDTVGIVDFDDRAATVLPATEVGTLTAGALERGLAQLTAQGGTDINLGLMHAITDALRVADTGTQGAVTNVFLLSDGNPTDGVASWLEIRRNVVAALQGTRIHVSTYAFGEDANGRELDALAGVTGGIYANVVDPDALAGTLRREVDRREQMVATNVTLDVAIDPAITIRHLFGHDQVAEPVARAALPSETPAPTTPGSSGAAAAGSLRLFAPNLAAGELVWVAFELALPEGFGDPGSILGTLAVAYTDALAAGPSAGWDPEAKMVAQTLAVPGTLAQRLVQLHTVGLWTSEVAFYARDDVRQADWATAADRLAQHAAHLEMVNQTLVAPQINEDVATLHMLAALAASLAEDGAAPASPAPAADRGALLLQGLNALGNARNGLVRVAP